MRQGQSAWRSARSPNPDEARSFIEAVRGERLEGLYCSTVTLGLRRGEVLGLEWQDIDFDAGTVHVRASLQRVNGKLELSETKTHGSRGRFRFSISSREHFARIARGNPKST